MRPLCVLSIAGSDSGAAAGIQADLKTFAAFGIHGLTAISAVTAQNTRTVDTTQVLAPALLLRQLDVLFADFRIAAVKIGMLGSAANARVVARWLSANAVRNIVIDPVLCASSGQSLLDARALGVVRHELHPLADVLTPNVPEAEVLLGQRIATLADMRSAAADLRAAGAGAVLIKGGHVESTKKVHDYFVDARGTLGFTHVRRDYGARGTGCTLSSAIAAGLALGLPPREATRRAERYLQDAFRRARRTGLGAGRILGHLPGRAGA